MAIFHSFPDPANQPASQRYLLLHNWRTAGSSTSSLLAANFGKRYLKVGLQYNGMGLPHFQAHQITTLEEVRSSIDHSLILGGHLFAGVTAFLPGDWQLWMTARNPIERARSGVLRFHGRPYKGTKNPDVNLFSHEGSEKLDDENDLRRLFNTSLRYERNGMCRRLAMMSIAPTFQLAAPNNLEKVPELSADYSDNSLYEAALARLASVRLLILTKHYTISTLCLERYLGSGPLLNPFTDLRLNGRDEKHTLPQREQLVNRSQHVLAETQSSDLKLWKQIKARFRSQVSEYQIGKRDLAVREALQGQPLFNPAWFSEENMANHESRVLETIAKSLAQRAAKSGEIADPIITEMTSWKRFTPEAADRIAHSARKFLARL